ncbi:hypothetical protein ANN_19012 [Periplaneta americana]|uniref:Uncharacterized protein n=1 Tax=Periplaneta americana TaxID=6978 RepID=A0ABQ8SSG9_PERAM|nr:hypothetical protein ANN_19012 [Periplaneta americana]
MIKEEPPKRYIPRSLDWQGSAGTVATSITGPNPTGFLYVGRREIFLYETPIDTAEDLVARVVEAAHVIRDNVGLFERCRHSIVRSRTHRHDTTVHDVIRLLIPALYKNQSDSLMAADGDCHHLCKLMEPVRHRWSISDVIVEIRNTWGDMKRLEYETPINTAEDLVARVIEAAHVIRDVDLFERCRHSIVRRYQLCNAFNGRHVAPFGMFCSRQGVARASSEKEVAGKRKHEPLTLAAVRSKGEGNYGDVAKRRKQQVSLRASNEASLREHLEDQSLTWSGTAPGRLGFDGQWNHIWKTWVPRAVNLSESVTVAVSRRVRRGSEDLSSMCSELQQ